MGTARSGSDTADHLAAPTSKSSGMFDVQPIRIGRIELQADRAGALYWPQERMLVVADLHLEKGSAFAERGTFLPPYDTRTTLGSLFRVIERYDPDTVVCLGDSFHDVRGADRLLDDDLDVIVALQSERSWIWVTGNHDPELPERVGGTIAPHYVHGGLKFVHEPTRGPALNEVAGHLHPAALIARQGYRLRRPCFVSNSRRLILPAFGAYAGGLNILDAAFRPMFGEDGLSVWMVGHEGVYPVAARQLRDD